MNLKEELIKLRNNIINRKKENIDNLSLDYVIDPLPTEVFDKSKSIYLNDKIDNYIKWNYKHFVKGKYTDIGEYCVPTELRNFIEKMAVWYELRYPDYEINRLMPGSNQENINISDVMFNNNRYINDLFDDNSDIRALDWDDFYNTSVFIKSLSWDERYRFRRAKYKKLVYLDPNYKLHNFMEVERKTAHLHLTSNGFVESAEGVNVYSNFKITNEQLKGMHVKDVVNLLKENNIVLPKDNELEETIYDVEMWNKQKEGLLDAVMYRIIERGGNRIGPRRGFLFAKEFNRNKDIPMMYAVDRTDPGLRLFINEYIKAGGSKDLVCYVGYFSRTDKTTKLDTVTVHDLILTQNNNAATFYTQEETNLHQRLVNALVSQVDQDMLRREQVNQLRLQRKLEKKRK